MDDSERTPLINRRPTSVINQSSEEDESDSENKLNYATEKVLSGEYESLDYDDCENELYQMEEKTKSVRDIVVIEMLRWLVMFFVGVLTGLVASLIDYCVIKSTDLKFSIIKKYIDKCVDDQCMEIPLFVWAGINGGLVFVAAVLTACFEPVAAGSGIPQIKCYLNGVKVPHVVRLKTIVVKVIGVISSVAGGLIIGKEGPMIHSGAVIAAGISQGRSDTFRKFDLRIFEFFRADTEKRDFVAGGAAAGVSAAFGAPVGGVLFSLEEGASFWNQALAWRIFFASMMSTFTLNVIQSYIKGHPWDLSYPGLFNFGNFDTTSYSAFELPIFILMGVLGGLFGALFNQFNYVLTKFRRRYINKGRDRVIEAMVVAIITATVGYVSLYFNNNCTPMIHDQDTNTVQFYCNDGQYSSTASILFQSPEDSVKSLFHDAKGTYAPATLIVYCLCVFILACWTYGLYVPSGLFIPGLLVGAAWGRLVGICLNYIFPDVGWVDFGKYSLIGAAAQLGGIVRMTISLTVIIMEATGNITFGLPIMIVLIVAKWVGDIFNEGIYDMHIHIQGVPILGWEPSSVLTNLPAREVMSHPVSVFRVRESVGRIMEVLNKETHNGFPVVENFNPDIQSSSEDGEMSFGTYRGIILRSQLIVLLKQRIYGDNQTLNLTTKDFRDAYPKFTPIRQIKISQYERDNCEMNLEPYMNPAAYCVTDNSLYPRVFKLFRALGLRHLVVVDKHHQVVGMVTRKDLARYKVTKKLWKVSMEELLISTR
ncbi:H(+)/Cl(-) exchange transporter 7-like [Saccostrea echinata]|uniref:H(+)/Cl(-) exchange transporter 7-like n=1 Tax=Saccostrea echinata TaxID=191078 RepID=UPI002A80B9C6|nr:H(+)/Cl(-) exchange transporter 7-like [Saccostrea echinata]